MIQSAGHRWTRSGPAEPQFRWTRSFCSVAGNIISKLKSNLPEKACERGHLYHLCVWTQSIVFWLSSPLLSNVGPKVVIQFMNMSEQAVRELVNIPVLHISWQPSAWLPSDRDWKHLCLSVPTCLAIVTSSPCSFPEKRIKFQAKGHTRSQSPPFKRKQRCCWKPSLSKHGLETTSPPSLTLMPSVLFSCICILLKQFCQWASKWQH